MCIQCGLVTHFIDPCPLSLHLPSQSPRGLSFGMDYAPLDGPKVVSLVIWQLTYKKQEAETLRTFKGYAENWHNVILVIHILLLKAVTISVHTEAGKEINSISWWGHNTEEHVGWKILLWYCCDYPWKIQFASFS